jgi:hypothetical protein
VLGYFWLLNDSRFVSVTLPHLELAIDSQVVGSKCVISSWSSKSTSSWLPLCFQATPWAPWLPRSDVYTFRSYREAPDTSSCQGFGRWSRWVRGKWLPLRAYLNSRLANWYPPCSLRDSHSSGWSRCSHLPHRSHSHTLSAGPTPDQRWSWGIRRVQWSLDWKISVFWLLL